MSEISLAGFGAVAALLGATLFSSAAPPERYRQDATFTLSVTDQPTIEATCQPLFGIPPEGRETLGCTTATTVVLPNPCGFPEDEYARMLCHELAHVNGWPATHDP